MRPTLQTTVSEKAMDRINNLVRILPERVNNGKVHRTTKADVLALYDTVVYNYFTDEQLIMEYENI